MGTKRMQLGVLLSLLGLGYEAEASERPFRVHCEASTRVVAGTLDVAVNPARQRLEYDLQQNHYDKRHSYQRKGSNQQGFGYSSRSHSSVAVEREESGGITVTAEGRYYDRATLVGEDKIVLVLKKSSIEVLGGYELGSLVVNGESHTLAGYARCSVIVEGEKACVVPPQNDCRLSPKRLCCTCSSEGRLSCH